MAFDTGALENIIYIPKCDTLGTALVGIQTGTVALGSKQQFFLPNGMPAGNDGAAGRRGALGGLRRRRRQARPSSGRQSPPPPARPCSS